MPFILGGFWSAAGDSRRLCVTCESPRILGDQCELLGSLFDPLTPSTRSPLRPPPPSIKPRGGGGGCRETDHPGEVKG